MFLLAVYDMESSTQKRHRSDDVSLSIQRYQPPQMPRCYKILQAANHPDMTMDLQSNGRVSIDGNDPHGERRWEGELLHVRWHWNSIEEKAKRIVHDPHYGGVMKSRVALVQYSHVLIPVETRVGPGGNRYPVSPQFIVTADGILRDGSQHRGDHASRSRGSRG